MKITIITPTICRSTLVRTCQSIDSQTYPDIEHIVVVDNPEEVNNPILKLIEAYNREIVFCDARHNNFGNTCRYNAFKQVHGKYVLYLDDDDYYSRNGAISDIVDGIKQAKYPDWGVFPITRFGEKFFNLPARRGSTCSNQFFHKAWINSKPIKWFDNGIYEADGQLIDFLREHYPNYGVLCGVESVANVDIQNKGK